MLYFQLTVRYSKMLADGPAHLVPKVKKNKLLCHTVSMR